MDKQDKSTLVDIYLNKANEAMQDAEASIMQMRLNNAANRLYYSSFYAVTALLVKDGHPVGSHAGAKANLGLFYIKAGTIPVDLGKTFSQMATMRERADYDCFFNASLDELQDILPRVKQLISKIEELISESSN